MHAQIKISTLEDLGLRHDFGADPIPDFSHKDIKWVPVITQATPAFDPDIEKLVAQPDIITINDLTENRFQVVALTQQEIDDEFQVSIDEIVAEVDRSGRRGQGGVRVRALIELFNQRDNYLTNRIAELQTALIALQASGGQAGDRLDGLPTSYLATVTRSKANAVQDYKDDVTAGNQNI
jgi:hypothetical protein